jgi:hypothetical protein
VTKRKSGATNLTTDAPSAYASEPLECDPRNHHHARSGETGQRGEGEFLAIKTCRTSATRN